MKIISGSSRAGMSSSTMVAALTGMLNAQAAKAVKNQVSVHNNIPDETQQLVYAFMRRSKGMHMRTVVKRFMEGVTDETGKVHVLTSEQVREVLLSLAKRGIVKFENNVMDPFDFKIK